MPAKPSPFSSRQGMMMSLMTYILSPSAERASPQQSFISRSVKVGALPKGMIMRVQPVLWGGKRQ